MHIASVRIGKCYSFVPRGQARQLQSFDRPDIVGRIALATPLACRILTRSPALQNQLAAARPSDKTLFCGGLEVDYLFGGFGQEYFGLKGGIFYQRKRVTVFWEFLVGRAYRFR
ncbi:MAG: hypothetical protein ABIH56_05245 [Candidatus Margulisiibacteriota bacterium]